MTSSTCFGSHRLFSSMPLTTNCHCRLHGLHPFSCYWQTPRWYPSPSSQVLLTRKSRRSTKSCSIIRAGGRTNHLLTGHCASPSLLLWDKRKNSRRSTPRSIPVLKKIHTGKSVNKYTIKIDAPFLRGVDFFRLANSGLSVMKNKGTRTKKNTKRMAGQDIYPVSTMRIE